VRYDLIPCRKKRPVSGKGSGRKPEPLPFVRTDPRGLKLKNPAERRGPTGSASYLNDAEFRLTAPV